jgi:flagellar basal-body rod modification protein FlgD
MSITAVETRTQTTTGTASASGTDALGKEAFLNLLVTQLRHQDPLNPMDSTDFTAQLAQFSSLEQLSNLNVKMENLTTQQGQLVQTQMVSAIGKDLIASGDAVQAGGGSGADCQFDLEAEAANVLLSIFDGTGKLVAVVDGGAMPVGNATLAWDGTDTNGNAVAAGTYTFAVDAFDAGGKQVTANTLTSARVTGVTYRDGSAYFLANGREVALDQVMAIQSPSDGTDGG